MFGKAGKTHGVMTACVNEDEDDEEDNDDGLQVDFIMWFVCFISQSVFNLELHQRQI